MNLLKVNNNYVEKYLRYISDEDKTNMDYFYLESLSRTYENNNKDVLKTVAISYNDNDLLLNYSGYNYRHINAALRGTWNYEENGDISKLNDYLMLAKRLEQVIYEHPTILKNNIMTYRGVDLDYFKPYGIESLKDLKTLEGKYMLDRSFVSTSIDEYSCFYRKENDIGKNYNVKIEYMIPNEFKDGIYLEQNSSYTPNQEEFLINASNLTRVSSVSINDNNTAIVRAVVIPKELYDDYYRARENNLSK